MLHEFITTHRDELISRCREKVATRASPPPTKAEIDHGVPIFLDQLIDELRFGRSANHEVNKTATQHGSDLWRQGFTVSQVVHDYGDVCQSITEMAVELNAQISADDFRMLNRCLDGAIASAVTEYGREDNESMDVASDGSGRLGVLARELRNSLHTQRVAFEVIKSGQVGVAGGTGIVLDRSLLNAQDLVDQLIAEIYVTTGSIDPAKARA